MHACSGEGSALLCIHYNILLNINCRPMDFLITPRHRWIYVAIFGVMGVNLFYVFISLFPVDSDDVFLWLLLNLSKQSNSTITKSVLGR